MNNIIHYGIGKDYLPNWGIKEALREIYQNFIDYGKYSVTTERVNKDTISVSITNNYEPTSLEFLRIGTSNKGDNEDALGKHGEGLKMALLIFARIDNHCVITTKTHTYKPIFVNNGGIEDCFAISETKHNSEDSTFGVHYSCSIGLYEEFIKDIITEKDIIFKDDTNGKIVNRLPGRVYCGGMFVAQVDNLSKAYDIYPRNMELDRDRCVPRSIDVNYHSSKLNSKHEKWNLTDTSYSDTEHIDTIPNRIKEQVTPKIIGNGVAFTYKQDGVDKVIENPNINRLLSTDSIFTTIVTKLKQAIIKHLGLYDILIEFKRNHVYNDKAVEDFDIILEQVKSGKFG